MTEYKVGQRVRIEWPDGSAVEGLLHEPTDDYFTIKVKGAGFSTLDPGDGRVVTVLSEPRPDEPTGLGAVVEARLHDARGWKLVRVYDFADASGNSYTWRVVDRHTALSRSFYRWEDLVDPVILSEGWTPPPTSHGMADVYNLADCRHCGHIRKRHSLSMSGCSVCSCSEFEL